LTQEQLIICLTAECKKGGTDCKQETANCEQKTVDFKQRTADYLLVPADNVYVKLFTWNSLSAGGAR
jgi:hypothetical protein